jgi:hypothetical protein
MFTDSIAGFCPVSIRPGRYRGWHSCHVRRGPLELIIVPQIGGRIMGLRWHDHDLFFTQPEREGQCPDLPPNGDVRAAKEALGFPLWGGDKTWLAPQDRWNDATPFVDLDSGPYELKIEQSWSERAVLRLTSRVCRETGVQISRTITVPAGRSDWTVKHCLFNASDHDVEWGLWSVTMLLRPADVYVPRRSGSQFHDGVKTFDQEGDSVALRGCVVDALGASAIIHCRGDQAFKYGVDADQGWLLAVQYVSGLGPVAFSKWVPVHDPTSYGHGCIAEVYNSDRYPYLELEAHGPVVRLRPGESFAIEERQAVWDLTTPVPDKPDCPRAWP